MSALSRLFILAAFLVSAVAGPALAQSSTVPLGMDDALRAGVERGPAGAAIRSAYLDFAFTTEALERAQASLDLADRLVQEITARVSAGQVAPIDVVSARAEQATRSQRVTQAANDRRSAELALKRLIVSNNQDPLWTATLEPSGFEPSVADVNASIVRTRALRSATAATAAFDAIAAATALESSAQSLTATMTARDAARQALAGKQAALDRGEASNFEVVTAQRALAQAETSVLQATLAYQKALVEFERVQVTR